MEDKYHPGVRVYSQETQHDRGNSPTQMSSPFNDSNYSEHFKTPLTSPVPTTPKSRLKVQSPKSVKPNKKVQFQLRIQKNSRGRTQCLSEQSLSTRPVRQKAKPYQYGIDH